jgi:hypothetical protein
MRPAPIALLMMLAATSCQSAGQEGVEPGHDLDGGTAAEGSVEMASTGVACPGFALVPDGCRAHADCQKPGRGPSSCDPQSNVAQQSCGGVCDPRRSECQTDANCPAGQICGHLPPSPCGCGPVGPGKCQPPCTAATCAADERCEPSGHCGPRPCADGFACGPFEICAPTRSDANQHGCAWASCKTDGLSCPEGSVCAGEPYMNGCKPLRCDAGARCPANWVCDLSRPGDPRGCAIKKCKADRDCDCGFCIMEMCRPQLWVCNNIVSPRP